jgi:hypothetical protein
VADPASDVGDGGSGHEGWVQASQLSVIVHRSLSTDELVRDVARRALAAAIPTFLIDEEVRASAVGCCGSRSILRGYRSRAEYRPGCSARSSQRTLSKFPFASIGLEAINF